MLSGVGIGLCPTALIADHLAAGTLTVLFEEAADEDKAYWLLSGPDLSEPAAVVRDWLLEEAASSASSIIYSAQASGILGTQWLNLHEVTSDRRKSC